MRGTPRHPPGQLSLPPCSPSLAKDSVWRCGVSARTRPRAEEHRRGFLRRGATGAQPTTAAGRPRRPGDVRRGTNRRRRGSRSARSEGPERKGSGRPPSVAVACAQPAASGKARGRAGEDCYQLRMGSAGTQAARASAVSKFTAPTTPPVPRLGEAQAPDGHFSQLSPASRTNGP